MSHFPLRTTSLCLVRPIVIFALILALSDTQKTHFNSHLCRLTNYKIILCSCLTTSLRMHFMIIQLYLQLFSARLQARIDALRIQMEQRIRDESEEETEPEMYGGDHSESGDLAF